MYVDNLSGYQTFTENIIFLLLKEVIQTVIEAMFFIVFEVAIIFDKLLNASK